MFQPSFIHYLISALFLRNDFVFSFNSYFNTSVVRFMLIVILPFDLYGFFINSHRDNNVNVSVFELSLSFSSPHIAFPKYSSLFLLFHSPLLILALFNILVNIKIYNFRMNILVVYIIQKFRCFLPFIS